MARPSKNTNSTASTLSASALSASAAVYANHRRPRSPSDDRNALAKPWQIEAYRHVNICGEARYAATLFAAMASRAEIGVSEANALSRKAVWVNTGEEVEALSELVPSVRDRAKLIRDYMIHRVIAGECYLIARERREQDPGYIFPPRGFVSWEDYSAEQVGEVDVLDPDAAAVETNPNTPVWEFVAVTEIRRNGDESWEVRYDNNNYIKLSKDDPVIRMWWADPNDRREAWSPFRSLLPTLREIEWLTGHIFRQVRSRLMSAGVWFLPNNMTFPPPPPDAVQGGAEAIAAMNEAEQFMVSLAASGSYELDMDEVSFPSVVMADPASLDQVEQNKLIQFWSEIDDKAMILRSDAVRRFSLGMDLPPEQVLGSSGLAVTGAGGSAGSVNHWGVWANEEQTISAHIEPALDDLVGALTSGFLRPAVPGTDKVIGYDTASLRLRQDRSKEAVELYDRGLLNAEVTLREVGFDPDNDKMSDAEFQRWLLVRLAGGSATPEQVQAALALLNVTLPASPTAESEPAPGQPGWNNPRSLDDHPYEGPPREQHDHSPAPFGALHASCEALALRAMEKYGNRLLNDGKRGKDRDRTTPVHYAHLVTDVPVGASVDFDFSMAPMLLSGRTAAEQEAVVAAVSRYCTRLVEDKIAYDRTGLIAALEGFDD